MPQLNDITKDRRHPAELGTCWVAPGQGGTWRALANAFADYGPAVFTHEFSRDGSYLRFLNKPTNLRLTGQPLTQYDRERWESGNVE